jgi:hypothetical protein
MGDEIYFQWQNEYLLRTIYPLREVKLRDFLFHYYEIDIWAELKGRDISDLAEDVAAFKAERTAQVASLQAEYERELAYFLGNHIDADANALETADPAIIKKLLGEHASFARYFPSYDSARRQKIYLDRYKKRLERLRKNKVVGEIVRLERNIRNVPQSSRVPKWRQGVQQLQRALPIVDAEMSRLYNFSALFQKVQGQRETLDRQMAQRKREQRKIENELRWKRNFVEKYPNGSQTPAFREDIARLENRLRQLNREIQEGLTTSIEARLKAQIERQQVMVNDLARWRAEQYQRQLEAMDHQQLLEAVVRRFLDDPARYPLWLQYMVIHFSGMRYRTAHGSWGDPKDLLLSLRIRDIHAEIQGMSDKDVLAACARSVAELRVRRDEGENDPSLAPHIKRLESQNPYCRRRALLNYRIDQEKDAINRLGERETLDALAALKDQIPEWMWKEVVARTQLRLRFAGEGWETLTPEERSEYLDRESAVFRETMIEWKRKHLTGWREEHDRSHRLIVTRAVCNEVAEHIQHLRGLTPPGGLTAKPSWYIRETRRAERYPDDDKPYFVKIRGADDLKPGASVLWLRWVKDYPNPWRIAHPLTLPNGDGLLEASLLNRRLKNIRKTLGKRIRKVKGNTSQWVYEVKGNAFRRMRIRIEERQVKIRTRSGKMQTRTRLVPVEQKEWLRWMHEATVIEVAETADGPVVLTFETALPYDDPRRSTIGIYRRPLRSLRYLMTSRSFNGTFAGYIPAGELPLDDLREMLDWNHIMLRDNFLGATEMAAYWNAVTR